jgi:hypothetical protein
VRRTFVAADAVDDMLRQTQPKAHDAWLDKVEEEGIDPLAPRYAGEVLKRLRNAVRAFQKELKPPPPREQDIRLPLLDDLFRNILENKGTKNPPPPPPDPRLVAIGVEQTVEVGGAGGVRMRAKVSMRLTDRHPADRAECTLAVRVVFDEDGRKGDDCPVTVTGAPNHFTVSRHEPGRGTVLVGSLSHDWVEFDVVSDEYDHDWTAQLLVSGEPNEQPDFTPAEEAVA